MIRCPCHNRAHHDAETFGAHMLEALYHQGVQIMGALDNLKAADAALKAEIAAFLTDIAGRLSGNSDADVQAVADDINAQVAALQAADVPAEPAAPADGTEEPASA